MLENDTLRNLPYVCQADSFTVTVSGMHYHSGYTLDSVRHIYRNDSLLIRIHYKEGPGFSVLSPFKLPIRFATPQPSFYTIYSRRFVNAVLTGHGTSNIGICTSVSGLTRTNNKPEFLNVFPNPTRNSLTIGFAAKHRSGLVILTDISGKMIRKEYFKETKAIQLDLGDLKAGIYLLSLQTESGITVQKIIKQ
ncbi:T9SS type A sorting domain-containing protein [Adhaeribacter soli]|nr:T9SS type A sorting domain-containing protein [Adhaeribacter soli]